MVWMPKENLRLYYCLFCYEIMKYDQDYATLYSYRTYNNDNNNKTDDEVYKGPYNDKQFSYIISKIVVTVTTTE